MMCKIPSLIIFTIIVSQNLLIINSFSSLISSRKSTSKMILNSNKNDSIDQNPLNNIQRYHKITHNIVTISSIALTSLIGLKASLAADSLTLTNTEQLAPPPTTTSSTNNTPIEASKKITALAYIDIKIANYTEESRGKNRAALGSGRLIVGLYGEDAPKSVQRFLETITSDGSTLPTYVNTQFTRIVDDTLLQIDYVNKLETINIGILYTLNKYFNVLQYYIILYNMI